MSLGSRGRVLFIAILFVATSFITFAAQQPVYAQQITQRSLTLQAGATGDAGSKPGGVVNHVFTFSIASTTSVGSILFQYCTTASGTCTMPTGLVTNTSGTTLGGDTGVMTGFTLVNTTAPNGSPYVTRTASAPTPGSETITLKGVTNPTATNTTFFVRIATYTSTDTTGTPIDTGSVAASTANQIILSGTMPESLIFCTGATISVNASNIPDCTTATAGTVNFNQLFSPTATATATSQMSASTNANSGYSITVNGSGLASGSNSINSMTTAATSSKGLSQFGMNLRANTLAASNPAVGADITLASNGTNFRGEATTGYNTPDTFKFNSGDVVADSAYTSAGPTDAQIYTASYIVNVSGSQPAGSYTTTLTYICTPTF